MLRALTPLEGEAPRIVSVHTCVHVAMSARMAEKAGKGNDTPTNTTRGGSDKEKEETRDTEKDNGKDRQEEYDNSRARL